MDERSRTEDAGADVPGTKGDQGEQYEPAVPLGSAAHGSLRVQEQRAREKGRGRRATAPWRMPWRGWKDVLLRTYEETFNDRLFYLSAGVAFFVVLALFPGISAFVSCYALFLDPSTITDQLSGLEEIIPAGAYGLIMDQVHRVIQASTGRLGFTFVLSFVIALWSANSGMKAIIDALNVVYEQKEERSFFRLSLISLAMTLGGIAVMLLATAAFIVLPLAVAPTPFGGTAAAVTRMLRWPVFFLLILTTLGFLYRYGPYRRPPRLPWVTVGSFVATASWLAASALLSWYLSHLANYDATYGSLGAAAGMMIWLWITFTLVLVGAELNAELEHQTALDSTVGPDKPLGRRGAVMADTVGKAME